jgi:hypothetical protein
MIIIVIPAVDVMNLFAVPQEPTLLTISTTLKSALKPREVVDQLDKVRIAGFIILPPI